MLNMNNNNAFLLVPQGLQRHLFLETRCRYAKQCFLPQLLLSNPPCPQRQTLQLQCLGLDEAPESDYTNDNAKDVDNIVSISGDIASSASVDTDMAVVLERARERLGDQVALEVRRWDGGGCACCSGEHVDELEDEEPGEGAAKVANTETHC